MKIFKKIVVTVMLLFLGVQMGFAQTNFDGYASAVWMKSLTSYPHVSNPPSQTYLEKLGFIFKY